MIRTYSELSKLKTFDERFNYLKLHGIVGDDVWGSRRYFGQQFYRSKRWRSVRNEVILRDDGCDLGVEGYSIPEFITIHHMNPITLEDIEDGNEDIFNPEFLICVSSDTHKALHYGDDKLLPKLPETRFKFDTCPWKV